MSEEVRIKKLRGSGGYVMAKVTDEEQMKGNLGGPDLFLAPVGRLDSEKITRYFCNTCEKEYEGSPKIDYVNPNEEVAENLMLVEKGQYTCETCNSTLAEYREFRKSDETQEIGVAKPMEGFSEPSFEVPQVQSSSFVEQGATNTANVETDIEKPTQIQETTPGSVSSIEGLVVYDENAKKVGTARQMGVDSSQNLVLTITKNDGIEAAVPWANVKKVGEIILLGQPSATPQNVPTQQQGTCTNCNFVNKPGSKFCEQCGSPQ